MGEQHQVDRLERLFRSQSGLVARTLECEMFAPSVYTHRPGGIPRECIYSSNADNNVSVLSSYGDLVAASWLRHDLPRRLIVGENGVGLLLWPSASRGLAGAKDLGYATQASFETGRAELARCAATPAGLGASMASLASASCRGANSIRDARWMFLWSADEHSQTQACGWSNWESMAQTIQAFLAAPQPEATASTVCVPQTPSDLRCMHNQVFVSFGPFDVAAVFVESSVVVGQQQLLSERRSGRQSEAFSLARAVHASLLRVHGLAASASPPLVMLNQSCSVDDADASLLVLVLPLPTPPSIPPPPSSPPSSPPSPSPPPPRAPPRRTRPPISPPHEALGSPAVLPTPRRPPPLPLLPSSPSTPPVQPPLSPLRPPATLVDLPGAHLFAVGVPCAVLLLYCVCATTRRWRRRLKGALARSPTQGIALSHRATQVGTPDSDGRGLRCASSAVAKNVVVSLGAKNAAIRKYGRLEE